MSRFQPFGVVHLYVVVTACAIFSFAILKTRKMNSAQSLVFERRFGYFLLIYYLLESCLRFFYLQVPGMILIPIDVCSILYFIAAYAFIRRDETAAAVVFFWTVALTLHSFITPTPAENFPSVEFVRYFATHGLLIFVACYILFATRTRLDGRAVVKSFVWIQALVIVAAIFDFGLGQNFLFLREKPKFPTAIDSLGPWPFYLVGMEMVCLVSFLVWWPLAAFIRKRIPDRSRFLN